MLNEPIKANDVRVKYFSGLFPWEIEADLNDWFEDADSDTVVLDIGYQFTLDEEGRNGPIWTLLFFAKPRKS